MKDNTGNCGGCGSRGVVGTGSGGGFRGGFISRVYPIGNEGTKSETDEDSN